MGQLRSIEHCGKCTQTRSLHTNHWTNELLFTSLCVCVCLCVSVCVVEIQWHDLWDHGNLYIDHGLFELLRVNHSAKSGV